MAKFEADKLGGRWKAAVSCFAELSASIWWADRLRTQYYLDLNFQVPAQGVPRYLFHSVTMAAYHLGWAISSLFRLHKPVVEPVRPVAFILRDNPSYLANLCPVIEELIVKGNHPTIFTRRRERDRIVARLRSVQGFEKMHMRIFEEVSGSVPLFNRLIFLLKALTMSLVDLALWLKSTTPGKWLLIPRFFAFAFVNRFCSSVTKRLLSEVKVLVSADDRSLWEAMFYRSADKGTRTYLMQHGVLATFSWPTHAETILVWGERHKEILTENLEADEQSIEITGAPGFDSMFRAAVKSVPHQDTICFLGQFHGSPMIGDEAYSAAVGIFCQAAEKYSNSGLRFVVKLHPRDSKGAFEPFASLYGDVVGLTGESLGTLLHRSLAVVLVDSTAMFESVILGVPVVQLKPEGIRRFTDFSGDGLTILCRNLNQLDEVLGRVVRKERDLLVQDLERSKLKYLANPGKAASAVAESLLQVL